MKLYDAHCHLQDERLEATLDDALARAREAGVERFMCCGSMESDWEATVRLAQREGVRISLGLHPWYVRERGSDWLAKLKEAVGAGAVAIGEIGLDFALADADRELQEELFLAQWRLSVERRLTVSIHCRGAAGRLMELIEAEGAHPVGFVLHSYGGSAEMVPRFASLNGWFSFSGSLTRPGNKRGPAALLAVPKERLLLESDAPDLAPHRPGQPPVDVNEPALMVHTLARAAELLEMDQEALAHLTFANATRLFENMEKDG